MELSEVVPWGRSLNEYKKMFSLSSDDLRKKILGCGDGPACFNAELSADGGNITSIDPIYQFSPDQIRLKIKPKFREPLEIVNNLKCLQ